MSFALTKKITSQLVANYRDLYKLKKKGESFYTVDWLAIACNKVKKKFKIRKKSEIDRRTNK